MTIRALPGDVQLDLMPWGTQETDYPEYEVLDCGHLAAEFCECHLMDMYWSGTGESMYDDSYIDYLNSGG